MAPLACIENIRTILITNYCDKPFNIPNIKPPLKLIPIDESSNSDRLLLDV